MKVLIPSALRSYTEGGWAEANGATLEAVLADLDRLYRGIRFRMIDEQNRIRPHIRFFVGGIQARDLARALDANAELLIAGTERRLTVGSKPPVRPAENAGIRHGRSS